MSNFDEAHSIRVLLKVSANSLGATAITVTQEWLFARVSALRDGENQTFAAIAEQLNKFGARSARGCTLAAEHVFSIYKKGKLRQQRLAKPPEAELIDVTLVAFSSPWMPD